MTTPLISHAPGRPPAEAARFHALGTVASVLVTDPAAGDLAGRLLRAELTALDAACSRFRGDSELSRLNRAGGREVRTSQLLTDALAAALGAAQATGGDVDPTCGRSLVSLGYDRDFAELPRPGHPRPAEPADPARPAGVPAAGWQLVQLDRARRTARVPAGVLLDLGATAKAFAADRAADRIAAASGCGVLVNLGGDIRVAGPPPDGGWCVGIADDLGPGDRPEGTEPAQTVLITGGGLATSSTRVRSWRQGRATVHHIVVPATGRPAQGRWRTATVAAASCLHANAASTAAIIRGDRAVSWLSQLGLPARLAGHDGIVLTVAGWPASHPLGARA